MSSTPKVLIKTLELVISREIATPEALDATTARHVTGVRAAMFDDPNIVGAGIADKISDGDDAGVLSLCFYVKKKLPKAKVAVDHLLPPVMAGTSGQAIFTDVKEIGEVVPQINKVASPIRSGFSVGHVDISAGTVGAIVKKGRKSYILSNSHVLADSGRGKIGDAVLYPGPRDGGRLQKNAIAKLASFKGFNKQVGFTNVVDAALAEIVSEQLSAIDPNLFGAKKPLRIGAPKRLMKVVKRGRSTGDTKSVIRDTNFNIQVDYGDGVGVIGFRDQVLCDTYTAGGDSGALVIDKASGAIVGLHFAGSSKGSVFTPIKAVIAALRFNFQS